MDTINSNESLRSQIVKYPVIKEIFHQELTTVKSLKQICCLQIRKSLDQRLLLKVNKLPLPQILKDYVSMKEIFGATTKTTSSSNLNLERNEAANDSTVNNNNTNNKNSFIVKEENIFDENNSGYISNKKAPVRERTLGISRAVIEQASKRFGFKKRNPPESK